jgi:membrane-associated phospholipid phosphatase
MPENSLSLRLTVAATLAVLLLVPFSLIAVLIAADWTPLHQLDLTVSTALHSFALGHHGWVRAMVVWSFIFDPNSLRVAALALAVWLWRAKHARARALWVVITMAAGGVLGVVLKLLVGRHRPDLLDPVARAAGYSFPSGHALNNALAAGVFLLVLLPYARDRPWRALLWTLAIVIPLLTGLTRIGLGVHFTSDVVAGWLMGVAVVAATAAGFQAWRSRSGRRLACCTDGTRRTTTSGALDASTAI